MEPNCTPKRYYDPPEDDLCPNDCDDGVIHGTDANGSAVEEKCDHECHWTPYEREAMWADAKNDAEKEGA